MTENLSELCGVELVLRDGSRANCVLLLGHTGRHCQARPDRHALPTDPSGGAYRHIDPRAELEAAWDLFMDHATVLGDPSAAAIMNALKPHEVTYLFDVALRANRTDW